MKALIFLISVLLGISTVGAVAIPCEISLSGNETAICEFLGYNSEGKGQSLDVESMKGDNPLKHSNFATNDVPVIVQPNMGGCEVFPLKPNESFEQERISYDVIYCKNDVLAEPGANEALGLVATLGLAGALAIGSVLLNKD